MIQPATEQKLQWLRERIRYIIGPNTGLRELVQKYDFGEHSGIVYDYCASFIVDDFSKQYISDEEAAAITAATKEQRKIYDKQIKALVEDWNEFVDDFNAVVHPQYSKWLDALAREIAKNNQTATSQARNQFNAQVLSLFKGYARALFPVVQGSAEFKKYVDKYDIDDYNGLIYYLINVFIANFVFDRIDDPEKKQAFIDICNQYTMQNQVNYSTKLENNKELSDGFVKTINSLIKRMKKKCDEFEKSLAQASRG